MKFALLTVSYSGLFYIGKALSIEEQIHKARDLGFDGLSIEAKRPVASPLDLNKAARKRIREVADTDGISLCAVESLSNFTSGIMEERENNLAMIREVLGLADDLNVRLVKIFAAWPGLTNDEEDVAVYAPYDRGAHYRQLYPKDLRKWHRALDGIREAADWAADLGITLLLQNHPPVLSPGYEDVLAMMQEVERKNVRLCLDVPMFYERQSDRYIKEAVEHCGKHVQLSHYGAWNFREDEDGQIIQDASPSFGGPVNYPAFVAALREHGFEGYLVSEYCLPVIKGHRIAGIAEIDKANQLALKYMKALVADKHLVS